MQVIDEGGYEIWSTYLNERGFFSFASQDALVRSVSEIARKAGRKLPLC
jgi:hypothetical protein